MTIEELRKMSEGALQEKLVSLRQEGFNLRFQKATSQLENTARIRTVRKDIARAQTALGEMKRQQGQEA